MAPNILTLKWCYFTDVCDYWLASCNLPKLTSNLGAWCTCSFSALSLLVTQAGVHPYMSWAIWAHLGVGTFRVLLKVPPPIKTPSEVSVAHPHSTRTPSQHHWGHVLSAPGAWTKNLSLLSSDPHRLSYHLRAQLYVLNDEQESQLHSSHSLKVRHIPHSPLLLHQCVFISPSLFFSILLVLPSTCWNWTRSSPCGLQMRLLVTPLWTGGSKS